MGESAIKASNDLVVLTLQFREMLTVWEAQHAAQLPPERFEYVQRLQRLLEQC